MREIQRQAIPFENGAIGPDEIEAVGCALRAADVMPGGPVSIRVQGRLAELTGAGFVRLTASVSGAMDLALHALEVDAGDEVLIPALATPALINAILCRGARPIFCDVDPRTLTLDPGDVGCQLNSRSRLLIPVHEDGVACDLAPLLALTRSRGIRLCEDASQGIGAAWMGRHLGTIGDAGWVSFEAGMNVSAGQGAAFLTNDSGAATRASVPSAFQEESRRLERAAEVEAFGGLARGEGLSDLLAALLAAQLDRTREFSRSRRSIWQLYHEALADLDEANGGPLRRPRVPVFASRNAHAYTLQMKTPGLRDRLAKELASVGIETRRLAEPLHLSHYARRVLGPQRSLPNSERVAECALRLPIFAGLTRPQAERVVAAVRHSVSSASLRARQAVPSRLSSQRALKKRSAVPSS